MLIDSDILIWQSRGHVGAAERLFELPAWQISIVTYIELAQGSFDKRDLLRLKKALAQRNTQTFQVTPSISQRAADLIDQFALSHGLRLADALIASTAIELNLTLLTANVRHFKNISELNIEPFVL